MREYIIINNQPVDTIHLELGKPRVRITLDESKWIVKDGLADSGSIHSILISPRLDAHKEKEKQKVE